MIPPNLPSPGAVWGWWRSACHSFDGDGCPTACSATARWTRRAHAWPQWNATSSRRDGVRSSTRSGAPATQCSSCTGSSTTASADSFPSATCSDRRVIAPSRFGYLGSSMPPNATPAAQADAFAALLDALGIDRIDVIGESAGATSALQLALRHPERVKHLAVLVGNLPGSPTAIVQPSLAKRVNRQFLLWALRTFAPSTMARLVAAVPERVRHES